MPEISRFFGIIIRMFAGPTAQHRRPHFHAYYQQAAAVAMTYAIHRVTGFSVVGPHSLEVTFADGSMRTIDFLPVLRGEIYGPLRDPSFFNQVALDHEVHTLIWPNGADFDPATLHDWPDIADDFSALAERWIDVTSGETG